MTMAMTKIVIFYVIMVRFLTMIVIKMLIVIVIKIKILIMVMVMDIITIIITVALAEHQAWRVSHLGWPCRGLALTCC